MNKLVKTAVALHLKSSFIWLVLSFFALSVTPHEAAASIAFEDVSQQAGITEMIQTAASAWGDLNGDGWPEIWVSNHDMKAPSLYLNLKNGRFVEASASVIVGEPRADFHGAAWADFDNDGDQDLVVTTGGGAGRGSSANHLFVNLDGKLQDSARQLGVDYPHGRGRTPLWFDADGDGKLDLLFMNQLRPDGDAPSAIFLQTPNGFFPRNDTFGFNPSGERSSLEKLNDLLNNIIHLRHRRGPGSIMPAEVFAQLADISGDGKADLLAYVKPMRIYSTQSIPFEEITDSIGFRSFSSVQDIAVEDFTGDGKMDMFLTRAVLASDVVHVEPTKILGIVKNGSLRNPNEVCFRCSGEITFNMYMPWADPSDPQKEPPMIYPGQLVSVPADGRSFTLSPDDPLMQQKAALPDKSIAIDYNKETHEWNVRFSYSAINFIAAARTPIELVSTKGFKPSKGDRTDILLIKGSNQFEPLKNSGLDKHTTACHSVAAGDFDNDMDVDLYLVCTDPTQNSPNILYENDGSGHFVEVPDAGGATGAKDGRGDQVSVADYDRDGFLDLFVTNGAGDPPFSVGPHQLFHNRGNTNHWIEIDLRGATSNRDGVGAVIKLKSGGKMQTRTQNGGMHGFSQSHQRIHFGLGNNVKVDMLTVLWPSGVVQELEGMAADHIYTVTESGTAK